MAETMTKEDALSFLVGIRGAFLYGMCIDSTTSHDALCALLATKKKFAFEARTGNWGSVDLAELRDMLLDSEGREVAQTNFRLFLRHSLIHRTHEGIVMYCDATAQFSKYEAAPWYQFARFYRNILAHHDGSTLNEWRDRKVSVATWRHHSLTPAEVGKRFYLDPWETFQLHADMYEFLASELR
jgi:hypothetical protein